jgi:hypothetical protein
MRKLTSFLRRKWSWAREKPWAWWTVLVLLVAAAVLMSPAPFVDGQPSDARIRLLALSLQLFGSVIAWIDLVQTAKSFRVAGTLRSHWIWLLVGLGCRKRASSSAHIVVNAGYAVVSGGRAIMTVKANTVDGRLDALEHAVSTLQRELRDGEAKAEQRAGDLVKSIQDLKDQQRTALQEVDAKVNALAVGSHDMLVFGALYVAAGTVIAALSPELALAAHGRWQDILARFV